MGPMCDGLLPFSEINNKNIKETAAIHGIGDSANFAGRKSSNRGKQRIE